MLSRRGVGTAVFGGMIAASAIGIFLIPPLYVFVQLAARKSRGREGNPHRLRAEDSAGRGGVAWMRARRWRLLAVGIIHAHTMAFRSCTLSGRLVSERLSAFRTLSPVANR